MLPCLAIGGDFFEYIDLPDGRFGFALGDVSGKGPPAALLGALTQGSLAAQTTVASGPADALIRLNAALVRRAIEGRFVTLFYAQLDPDGTLTFCNGGHNPPFLVGGGGDVRRLETGGMPMGLFDGLPFTEESVTMAPGDFLVLFSDGVSEALDLNGAEFEDERILESIAGAPRPGGAGPTGASAVEREEVHGRGAAERRRDGGGGRVSGARAGLGRGGRAALIGAGRSVRSSWWSWRRGDGELHEQDALHGCQREHDAELP